MTLVGRKGSEEFPRQHTLRPSSQTNHRTTRPQLSKSLHRPMRPTTSSSPSPTAAVTADRHSRSGPIRIVPFDGAEESESSYPAFSRPTLTRKPSIRVRRHDPDELCDEEETRAVSAALREGSYVPGPLVAPIPATPEGRDQHISHPPSSGETSRNRRLSSSSSSPLPPPPRREMSLRADRPTPRKRSKLATLCRPRLLGWRVPLPLLLRQRGQSPSPGVMKASRWEGRFDSVHAS
jgi:hypothetical protein